MPDPTSVARNPALNQVGAVWSNGNNLYGIMSAGGVGGLGSDKVQLVVTPLGGKPKYYSADASHYDAASGGTITTGLGTITSTGGMIPRTTLTTTDGSSLDLKGGGTIMVQNLQKTIAGNNGPAVGPK